MVCLDQLKKCVSFSRSTLEHGDGLCTYISYIRQWTKSTGYTQVWYYDGPVLIRRRIITDFISSCRTPIPSSHCTYLSTIPSNVCTTSCRLPFVSDYIPIHHNSALRQLATKRVNQLYNLRTDSTTGRFI